MVDKIAKYAFAYRIKGYAVAAVEIPEPDWPVTPDICSRLYKRYPDANFIVAYSWSSEERAWMLAFRSDKEGRNFDVSVIAKHFSGGGHRNAAGGKVATLDEIFEPESNWDLY